MHLQRIRGEGLPGSHGCEVHQADDRMLSQLSVRLRFAYCSPEVFVVAAIFEARTMVSISRAMLSPLMPLADAHVQPQIAEVPVDQSCVKHDGGTYCSIWRENVAECEPGC